MRNWVFLTRAFWRAMGWGLIADWGSKGLANLLIEPSRGPIGPLSGLVGRVYPYPPGAIAITHFEHWREQWYHLGGPTQGLYDLLERITPFHIPMVYAFFTVALVLPLLVSLGSIRSPRPQIGLSVALGFWIAAAIGNKVEVLLFGHATDWLWLSLGGLRVITNIADLLILAAFVILIWPWRDRTETRQTEAVDG